MEIPHGQRRGVKCMQHGEQGSWAGSCGAQTNDWGASAGSRSVVRVSCACVAVVAAYEYVLGARVWVYVLAVSTANSNPGQGSLPYV